MLDGNFVKLKGNFGAIYIVSHEWWVGPTPHEHLKYYKKRWRLSTQAHKHIDIVIKVKTPRLSTQAPDFTTHRNQSV